MATQSIRAIYRDGMMRLLDPVELKDGQEVSLIVMPSENERALVALADLLVDPDTLPEVEGDADELMRLVAEAWRGQPPLSDLIIEERQSGP
jgi:predicted DNA-binding antitoxin AbrB/MazE fold protein